MKGYFKITFILAALLIIFLQVILLLNICRSIESQLYTSVDESFSAAVKDELVHRVETIHIPSGTILAVSPENTMMQDEVYLGYNDFADKNNSQINLDSLKYFFSTQLKNREIRNLSFKIIAVNTDTIYYKSVLAFKEDESFQKISYRELKTHIIPTKSNFTQGIQAIISNPYKAVLEKMWMLLIASFVIIVFVIYCLARLSYLLNRMKAISDMRQDYTHGMIHDMRNPLSSIGFAGEDLNNIQEIKNNPDAQDDVRIINKESSILSEMCKKILVISKLERRKLQFKMANIDLEKLFGAITDKYMAMSLKKVDFEIDAQCKSLLADESFVNEMLCNLVDNSIKYSGNTVNIKLSSVLKGDITEITVLDNGNGIDEKNKKGLFDKFERGKNASSADGYGIGLNYVYQLMKAMNGYTEIKSKPGDWTEVTLGFPNNR
ncbi:MAG: HAMP domain-containing histidine kinase [Bacteroidales bacterium]|jgi:two-component system phosphate regulon sensor histidine kinase PhoR|nr:HAMP domain-containing histidine kinase [Bacteroidales bacterium]MCI1733575.1 HAMP domain-containing histidine kinase [Bacteroidales bacterium]